MRVQPEQKPVNWMTDAVSRFYKTGDFIAGSYTGTRVTAKDLLRLLQHRRFVTCEQDLTCFVELLPSLVEVFAGQVLNLTFNLAVNEEGVRW